MKFLDKIVLLCGLLILGGCALYYVSAGTPKSMFKPQKEKGENFKDWQGSAEYKRPAPVWRAPKFDPETGWNYDLFTSPETTWLTSEKQYIAKELPKKVVQEILGLELKSISSPNSRVRVESCNSAFPPKTRKNASKKTVFEVLLKLQADNNTTGTVNFVNIPGVKMTKEEIGVGTKSARTICTLTAKTPVPVVGLNAKFKSLKIAKGDDGSGDGALVTRYMVELIDEDNDGEALTAVETFYKKSNIVEVVLQDEKSPKQWRIVRRDTADPEAPDYTLFERENSASAWEKIGKELKFSSETGTHEVKMLDTDAEQVTIVTQPKTEIGEKPKKSRVVILDISK